MVNYQNGKIYAIRSHETDKVYIGSTTQPLSKRLASHRDKYKAYNNGKYQYVTSFELLKHDDHYIELIEDFPCERKELLHKKEGELIRSSSNCVNKHIMGRTGKEYRNDNRDALNKKKSRKETCECGCEITNAHLARHKRTKKHKNLMESKKQN